jgi:hypothetical protein
MRVKHKCKLSWHRRGLLPNLPLQRTRRKRRAAERQRQAFHMASDVKHFRLAATDIRSLAPGHGSCIASDLITVGGQPVGYMYREVPDQQHDSGWRFFSGQESQAYADDASNFAIVDVNTIANYDPSIIGLLFAPVGSAYGRNEHGDLIPEQFPRESDA